MTETNKNIIIPTNLTVKELAGILDLSLAQVVGELVKNKIYLTANENIDPETALLIASELGFEAKIAEPETDQESNIKRAEFSNDQQNLKPRPTVVTFLGHVDHGKTSLIDKIRQTNVVASEAGKITQHISIYQIKKSDSGSPGLTLIDTPGHEAFSSLRQRGTSLTDIAVLVIAADEGLKPQTKESLEIIKKAFVPLVVVINKIDKSGANPEKIKKDLVSLGVNPEEWGGDTIVVETSAETGEGIDKLIEMLDLKGQTLELKANRQGQVIATVLESRKDPKIGLRATLLVQSGTLKIGSKLFNGATAVGKVRILKNTTSLKNITKATPGTPVIVYGLEEVPATGSILQSQPSTSQDISSSARIKNLLNRVSRKNKGANYRFNLILKADTAGSLEALLEMLDKIESPNLKINILEAKSGNIEASDIDKAHITNALVIGFHCEVPPVAASLAKAKGVKVRTHQIIYHLKEDLIKGIIDFLPTIKEEAINGKLKVLAIFRTEKKAMIVGGKITTGQITKDSRVRVVREDEVLGEMQITELQQAQKPADVVKAPNECGLKLKGPIKIIKGDKLEFFSIAEKKPEIKF